MIAGAQASRAWKAAAITLMLVIAAPVANVLIGGGVGPAAEAEVAAEGIRARDLVGAGDPFEALLELEGVAGRSRFELPPWFEEEVGLPPDCRDVRADPCAGVMGCVVDGSSDRVFAGVRQGMQDAGWRVVPIGGVDGATFVKEEGRCRWVMVTCTQVGEATSIVYRCGALGPA